MQVKGESVDARVDLSEEADICIAVGEGVDVV